MEKSQSLQNIGKAITLFQTKMEKVKKDASNPFFKSKYATLSNILESIQLPLAESGLSFCQIPDGDCLTTILIHNESGEFLQGCYSIKPVPEYLKEKDRDGNVIYRGDSYISPQGIGSAITYARRYALSAILGINVDDDDDGNAASKPHAPASTYTKPAEHKPGAVTPNPATQTDGGDTRPWISEKQFNGALERINNGEFDLLEKLKREFRMKKAYRETLEGAANLSKSLA